jgi:hypothetical protein
MFSVYAGQSMETLLETYEKEHTKCYSDRQLRRVVRVPGVQDVEEDKMHLPVLFLGSRNLDFFGSRNQSHGRTRPHRPHKKWLIASLPLASARLLRDPVPGCVSHNSWITLCRAYRNSFSLE